MDRTKQRFSHLQPFIVLTSSMRPQNQETLSGWLQSVLIARCFSVKKRVFVKRAILWHLYSNCCNGFCRIKHMINTHRNLVKANKSLQFLVYFADDEAGAYMCLNPSFCKVKHGVHFQCPF